MAGTNPYVELLDYASKRGLDLGAFHDVVRDVRDDALFAADVLVRLRFNGDDVARAVHRATAASEREQTAS